MRGSCSLAGIWDLCWIDAPFVIRAEYYSADTVEGKRFLPAAVPGSVHEALCDLGLLDDVIVGINALKARWLEDVMWVYRTTITAPAATYTDHAWLEFARLEYDAAIYLNGELIATHANAHIPVRVPVSGKLREGANTLAVCLNAGLHGVADKPGCDYGDHPQELLVKRTWQRKPQYQCGWDWNPRLMNVGILGEVRLEWSAAPVLRQTTVFAVAAEDLASAVVHARVTVEHAGEAMEGVLTARIREIGAEVHRPTTIPAGESRHALEIAITDPQLWWPIGHGAQHLYTVDITLACAGETQHATRRTGVRRVTMEQGPHPQEGRYCILTINNRPIFCKGGNWVPADMLYGSVTPARTRELVDLAVAANFNLLRIWGGGLFIDHVLGEACDEQGVLIWHDFLFACGKYPGDDPDFAAEVRREVTHAVRELAHHPSLVVWCGNNEIESGDWETGFDHTSRTHPHYAIFHHDIPKIVHDEDPSKLHWISSPWSPDYLTPNSPIAGDQHPWEVTLGSAGVDWWHYRTCIDRFPNEGGVFGASSIATLRQFLPVTEQYPGSPSWDFHDNCFCLYDHRQRGAKPRARQFIEYWLGGDAGTLSLEAYALASGLLQAEGLLEYISNYRRRMFDSACAVFWMFNDSWPTTHGWTIVDYYRRKKLAYHPVRRAFQPVTVVAAEDGNMVTIFGINDTPAAWRGELDYGLFTLDGQYPLRARITAHLSANASTRLASFTRAEWEAVGLQRSGAFAVLSCTGEQVAQHRLFCARFRDMTFASPQVTVTQEGDTVTLTCPVFAWGVCLDVEGEQPLADNCFDLLPGIPYRLQWLATLGEPAIAAIGSRDAFGERSVCTGGVITK